MATVTITIKDIERETVDVELDFEPHLKKEGDMTRAQYAAGVMMEALTKLMNGT